MSNAAQNLPDDPARRLRIATLKKQVFGKSSEKIGREIEQLEPALEDLSIAAAESEIAAVDDGQCNDVPGATLADRPMRRRPRVSDCTPRERQELDPGTCCPDCGGDLRVATLARLRQLDLIAAQPKVVCYPAGFCFAKAREGRSPGSRNPAAAANAWCRCPPPAGRSLAAWRVQAFWPTFLSPGSTITFRFIARTRSSPGWVPISRTARWSIGAVGR